MSDKYLVVGATGAIGSNLAEQLYSAGKEIHLVGRDEDQTKSLSEKFNCDYSIVNVLNDGFVEKLKSDIEEVKGIAYCVGSIDLKPFRMITEADLNKCMKLNLYSAIDLIKGYQESLKKNKGSVVLFSTVAAQRGFTNHSIIASTKAAVEGLTVSLAAEFAPAKSISAPSCIKKRTTMAALVRALMSWVKGAGTGSRMSMSWGMEPQGTVMPQGLDRSS